MRWRFVAFIIASIVVAVLSSALSRAQMKRWNNAGLTGPAAASSAPAPRRDLSGIWDAGQGGIQPTGYNVAALFTPLGAKMAGGQKPRNRPRHPGGSRDNDRPSTLGDPAGSPPLL